MYTVAWRATSFFSEPYDDWNSSRSLPRWWVTEGHLDWPSLSVLGDGNSCQPEAEGRGPRPTRRKGGVNIILILNMISL